MIPSAHPALAPQPLPLKILLLDPHMGGGGQVRYVASLAQRFVSWGHQVSVGCKAGSVLAERAAQAGAHVIDTFEYRRGLRLGAWWRDILRLRRLERAGQFQIIHVNGSQESLGRCVRPPAGAGARAAHSDASQHVQGPRSLGQSGAEPRAYRFSDLRV